MLSKGQLPSQWALSHCDNCVTNAQHQYSHKMHITRLWTNGQRPKSLKHRLSGFDIFLRSVTMSSIPRGSDLKGHRVKYIQICGLMVCNIVDSPHSHRNRVFICNFSRWTLVVNRPCVCSDLLWSCLCHSLFQVNTMKTMMCMPTHSEHFTVFLWKPWINRQYNYCKIKM